MKIVQIIQLSACALVAFAFTDLRAGNEGDVAQVTEPSGKTSTLSLKPEWTFLLGGSGSDNPGWLHAPHIDDSGVLTFTGTTTSPDFPVSDDALQKTFLGGKKWGKEDLFLVRYDTRHQQLLYSTLLGGAAGPEHIADILVDPSGLITLVGNTGSSDYPVSNDAQTPEFQGPVFRHADGFLTQLDKQGKELTYSSFFGGTSNDWLDNCFVQDEGSLVVFGLTGSKDFPRSQDVGKPDGLMEKSALFVMKLDAKTKAVQYSRILFNAWSNEVEQLPNGDFLIVASTKNPAFPATPKAFDQSFNGGSHNAGGDIALMCLSSDLKEIKFATLFGGSADEFFPKVIALPDGDIVITGRTGSSDLPVTNDALVKEIKGSQACFLARFDANGNTLKYCTYFGSKQEDQYNNIEGMYYNAEQSLIYVSVTTASSDFPVTPDAFQALPNGKHDIYLMAFDPTHNTLAYGTYIGGTEFDGGALVTFDREGGLILLGITESKDFPGNSTQKSDDTGKDIFISRFSVGF